MIRKSLLPLLIGTCLHLFACSKAEQNVAEEGNSDSSTQKTVAPVVCPTQPSIASLSATAFPNDTQISSTDSALWGLYNTDSTRVPARYYLTADHSVYISVNAEANVDIRAPWAWALQTDCSSVPVAVLDTGVAAAAGDPHHAHPDLINNIDLTYAKNFSVTPVNTDVTDNDTDSYHGTHVSGIIAAEGNNNLGVSGVCWRAKVTPVKVLDADGEGYASDIADGIHHSVNIARAKIINLSLGGDTEDSSDYRVIGDMILNNPNTLFVVAAGNSQLDNDASHGLKTYPAAYGYSNMIVVGANYPANDPRRDNYGMSELSIFSNYGAGNVHLTAPGWNILSTSGNSSYRYLSGTSQSTPFVTGAAALLWSYQPSLTMADLRKRIISPYVVEQRLAYSSVFEGHLDRIPRPIQSCGRLNLQRLFNMGITAP